MILEHSEEILNVNTIESASLPQTRSVLSHDQVIQWTKSKVRVYSDSVQCLGKMNESKDAIIRCEGQVEEFKMSSSYKELVGIDGEAIEFEWNIFPKFWSLQILRKFQDTGHPVVKSIKRHHTLHQCGCFKHRALVPNHSFCKSAQYLRSSFELV